MKLFAVAFRERVSLPGSTAVMTESRCSIAQGYDIELDQGIITVTRIGSDEVTLVPLSNVAWAKREQARPKKVA